jgi:hypothetical protein
MYSFSPLLITLKGKCLRSACTSASWNFRPIRRFASKTLSELVHTRINQIRDRALRVVGIHIDLILSSVANQAFFIAESNVRRSHTVTLIISDDLYAIILPNANASEEKS